MVGSLFLYTKFYDMFLGEFEMRLDLGSRTLVGHKKGQPANWRRCVLVRAMTENESTASMPDHDHSHVHTATCGH